MLTLSFLWIYFYKFVYISKGSYDLSSICVYDSSPDYGGKLSWKVANSFSSFKNLEPTVNNQNCIHDEIKSRLNLGNAYYSAVKNILTSVIYLKIQRLRKKLWSYHLYMEVKPDLSCKGGKQIGGVWEQNTYENIWT